MININKTVKELKADYKLTDYEALDIATKIDYNKIMQSAFVVTSDGLNPNALEFIGMSLKDIAKNI